MPPSETKAYRKFVAEHGREPQSYQEVIGQGIGPATGKWKRKQWEGKQVPVQESRFDNMRVSGFGEESSVQQEYDILRKYGFDPNQLVPQQKQEKEEILSVVE